MATVDWTHGVMFGSDPIAIGYGAVTPPQNCILIGANIDVTQSNSVIVANGPIKWSNPRNNINFAEVMEADSESKNVLFPGNVGVNGYLQSKNPIYQQIEICSACLSKTTEDEHVFGIYDVCIGCIRDIAIQFRAKESWAETNGDPMKKCFDMIKTLQDELKQCKEEIAKLNTTTITSGE